MSARCHAPATVRFDYTTGPSAKCGGRELAAWGLHRPRRHDVTDPPARRTLSSTPRAMGSIRKFWRLSQADRALLVQAAVWLGATRVVLWVLPFRLVRRLLAQPQRPSAEASTRLPSRDRQVS